MLKGLPRNHCAKGLSIWSPSLMGQRGETSCTQLHPAGGAKAKTKLGEEQWREVWPLMWEQQVP